LKFLSFLTLIKLLLIVARVAFLLKTPDSNVHVYDEPFTGSLIRWSMLVFSTLGYVAVIGYWTEKLSYDNESTLSENVKITKLLTERENLISSLLKANKTAASEALSASIAHELNQPISATLLNAQFLTMLQDAGKLDQKTSADVIRQIEFDAKRSGAIIGTLRSIFTNDVVESESLNVAELIHSSTQIYKAELLSNKIQLSLNLDGDISIIAHKGQMLQVLLNLINNAIQSLNGEVGKSKKITISSYIEGGYCTIDVEDTGPGVGDDVKSQLFELLSGSKSDGMGLGLWLCSHILGRHAGKISYSDVGEEGGARFTITLPIASS